MDSHHARNPEHAARLKREAASLRDDVVALLSCRPGCRAVGKDGFVLNLKPFFAPDVDGLTALKVMTAKRCVTVVTAPGEMFDQKRPFRRQLFKLVNAARAHDRAVVLAPKKAIRLQPRLANARLLRRCGTLNVDEDIRDRLVDFVSASDGPTAETCAAQIERANAIDLVFCLVACQVLRSTEHGRLGPSSRLEVIDRHAS